jgi:hypothetical protein
LKKTGKVVSAIISVLRFFVFLYFLILMFDINDRFLIIAITGSQAYGLAIDLVSDTDLQGLFIAPKSYYLGLKNIEQIEGKGKEGIFTSREGGKGLIKINWTPEKF